LQRRLRVNASVVRRIALGASPAEIAGEQWGEHLPDRQRWADLPPAEALPALELALQRYLARLAWNTLAGYSLHLGTVLAYEVLLENEARDLITVIEGKAAGWSPEQIQSELIGLAIAHA
jgi:vacuolar-type H+-ATPase subunit C/Vma6